MLVAFVFLLSSYSVDALREGCRVREKYYVIKFTQTDQLVARVVR